MSNKANFIMNFLAANTSLNLFTTFPTFPS